MAGPQVRIHESTMALPSISVCIPTRNRAESLRSTLAAMQEQTRPYTELIVGDDASDDNTREVVESFRDLRIRYVRHHSNVGIYPNWNGLIGLCSGDYICIYHDHDQYLGTILERSASLLDLHPDMTFVHTAVRLINGTGDLVGVDIRPFPAVMPGSNLRMCLANGWHSPVMAASAMVRRTAYCRVGFYEPKKYGLGCDKHMWFQLAQEGTVGYVAGPQANIRVRENGAQTALFSWDSVFGIIRMRHEEVAELYASDPVVRTAAERRVTREKSFRLLMLSLRALLLDRPEAWSAEEQRVLGHMGSGARLLYWSARASKSIRRLLKSVALPLHYKLTARRVVVAQRRAEAYAAQHNADRP
jgi:hypothetical protein